MLPELEYFVELIERPASSYNSRAPACRAELEAVKRVLRMARPIADDTHGLVGPCGDAAHLDRALARLDRVTGRKP
jgi:hypothetical protein